MLLRWLLLLYEDEFLVVLDNRLMVSWNDDVDPLLLLLFFLRSNIRLNSLLLRNDVLPVALDPRPVAVEPLPVAVEPPAVEKPSFPTPAASL